MESPRGAGAVLGADRHTGGADSGTPGVAVSLRGLRRTFGSGSGAVQAVDGIDLDVLEGEFLTVLGPSGSGKTTVLRLIAGFELPTAGTILLGGRDVTRAAPFERDVNTVFQDYALFPHLTVRQNVEYGLKVKGVPRAERRVRAREALLGVRLEGYEDRRPAALSGGQRQRVALARALVNRPKLLLLDEPFGALDLKLREQMQVELKEIQREVGITFVFVTHDQQEALTMSDRIVVVDRGRIAQVGSPAEVYEHPNSEFVAGFVGTSNVVGGEPARGLFGEPATYSLRPERIRLADSGAVPAAGEGHTDGTVRQVVYLGAATRVVVEPDGGGELTVHQQNSGALPGIRPADRVRLLWSAEDVYRVPDAP